MLKNKRTDRINNQCRNVETINEQNTILRASFLLYDFCRVHTHTVCVCVFVWWIRTHSWQYIPPYTVEHTRSQTRKFTAFALVYRTVFHTHYEIKCFYKISGARIRIKIEPKITIRIALKCLKWLWFTSENGRLLFTSFSFGCAAHFTRYMNICSSDRSVTQREPTNVFMRTHI